MEKKHLDLVVAETLNQFDLKPLGVPIKHNKPHVKRPMNAFMVWSRSARKTITQNSQSMPSNLLSKTLGDMWNQLSYEQKLPFIEEANRLKEEHSKQNPGYKYQPKRKPKKGSKMTSQVIKQKSFNFENERSDRNVGCSNSNQMTSSVSGNFCYPSRISSEWNYSQMQLDQNIADTNFRPAFNSPLDHQYFYQSNYFTYNYDANLYNYPYSPYSVNSSYSIDLNASN